MYKGNENVTMVRHEKANRKALQTGSLFLAYAPKTLQSRKVQKNVVNYN